MFSALNQGSLIYILDKSSGLKFKIGEVLSVSAPRLSYNGSTFGNTTIDLKVLVDGTIFEYNAIPSTYTIVSYNNGKVTLSETKQGLLTEVESLLLNSKLIIDNIETYKQNIVDCESILKELNPQFAKDKERDDRLNSLESKFKGVENKIDQILNLVTDKKQEK